MERHDLNDDLDRRLRAARPAASRVGDDAFDGALLARVRQQPIASRRSVPRGVAVPIAAGAIAVATAAVVLGGGPDNVGGPPTAAAITRETLQLVRAAGRKHPARPQRPDDRFRDPHARVVAVRRPSDGRTGADRGHDHLRDDARRDLRPGHEHHLRRRDRRHARPAGHEEGAPGGRDCPASAGRGRGSLGDAIVTKVRTLLGRGELTVSASGLHDGVDSWAISLGADAGGRSGRSGSLLPTGSRSSWSIPAATRASRRRTSAGRSTRCSATTPRASRCSPSPVRTRRRGSSTIPRRPGPRCSAWWTRQVEAGEGLASANADRPRPRTARSRRSSAASGTSAQAHPPIEG